MPLLTLLNRSTCSVFPGRRTSVQRLFYWHVAKAFYRPDLTFDEMNHINFDW